MAERLRRELRRQAPRRAAELGDLRRPPRGEGARGVLAARVQPRTAAQLARGSAPSLRGGKRGTCAYHGANPTLIVPDQRSGACHSQQDKRRRDADLGSHTSNNRVVWSAWLSCYVTFRGAAQPSSTGNQHRIPRRRHRTPEPWLGLLPEPRVRGRMSPVEVRSHRARVEPVGR